MASRRALEMVMVVLSTLANAVRAAPFEDSPVHEVLRQEFQDAFETGHAGPVMQRVAQGLDGGSMMRGDLEGQRLTGPESVVLCSVCQVRVNNMIHSLKNGTDPLEVANNWANTCIDNGMGNSLFCRDFIALITPQVFWVLNNTEGVTSKDFCGTFFAAFGCNTDNPDRVWEATMPTVPKPPVTTPALPEPGAPVMKVLHLADTHYDPYYLPGSNAECGERFLCCRAESGPLETPEAAAGYWGDYRTCDASSWLLEAIYTNINKQHPDLDFIIWTGDLVPHNVWNTSKAFNLDTIRAAVQMVKDYFPGVPVFPALGNHDAHPVNAYPQPYIDNEFDISWLYDEIVTLWETWLPSEVATSIAYSGYYSTLIKTGLRILSINSNYGYGFNWWLVRDEVDPGSELEWMAAELQAAEDAGEKVYLISHHSPGDRGILKSWSHQYNRIVLRYESTIAGLFYGHTHMDHIMMVYDPEDPSRAAHVGYVGPSQTTLKRVNPGYKVYTVDGDYEGSSYRVLDHETYIMDLDEANANVTADPRFFLLYSAKDEYGLDDLTPASWSALVDRMNETDSAVFDLYYKNYYKNSRPWMEEGCDQECKSDLLCRLVVSDTSDYSRCDNY